MPVIQCPKCGARQLIEKSLIGQVIACIRCEKTFSAAMQMEASGARSIVVAGAALLVGVLVSWIMLRGH